MKTRDVLFSMFWSFILGAMLVCAILLPNGDYAVDQHFPDFWNAECE